MDSRAAWLNELEHPTAEFLAAFAGRIRAPEGARGALREAVIHLTPLVDWEGYLPQTPHGLLGLASVLSLEGYLSGASFLRLLATQLHAFAHESRSASGRGLSAIGRGSGHWPNLEMALRDHRPAIAWGEALGVEAPTEGDFTRMLPFIVGDMANVGHKVVMVRHLEELAGRLECPRVLLPLAAWIAAAPPSDRFWSARARQRLEGANLRIPQGPACLDPERHHEGAREICDLGFVAMLDAFTARLKDGAGEGDLLSILVLAAADKQIDARRDLEGKTAWNFVYLAALPFLEGPEPLAQAACLLNFFPSEEPEDRLEAAVPAVPPEEASRALLDAILDGEPACAMGLVPILRGRVGEKGVLRVLAEAVSCNDPVFNHGYQVLALAAALELLPRITEAARGALLQALAKFLASSQGSGELGRKAEKALKG